jgi:predicted membrane protein
MELIDDRPKKTNNTRVIIGLVFLTLGAMLFADKFNFFDIDWRKYILIWPNLLILIGLISLGKSESRVAGFILVAVGGFFLGAKLLGYPYNLKEFFWPTVFVALGLILIFQRGQSERKRKNIPNYSKGVTSTDYVDDVAIFGGSEQKVTSKNFKGGRISNIFGGSTFDFTDAEMEPGKNVLDLFCLFGGSTIIVPSHWKVKIDVTSIFGGYSDKRKISTNFNSDETELVIKGVVIFGGGDIK